MMNTFIHYYELEMAIYFFTFWMMCIVIVSVEAGGRSWFPYVSYRSSHYNETVLQLHCQIKNKLCLSFSMTVWEQWVNCLVQGQNDRFFLPCQIFRLLVQHSNHQATCRPILLHGWSQKHKHFAAHEMTSANLCMRINKL